MTRRTLAVDVGGVLYYDEPFDLAWLQGVWELTRADDPAFTMDAFLQAMRDFYQGRAPGSPPPSLFPPNGTKSWQGVRERWPSLVQPVPGAVDALSHFTEEYEVCIVANQPPECLAALRTLGIEQQVQLVALDSLVGYAKPDPRLFKWAMDQLNWKPEHTIVIGDRPDHDAAPALALGCSAAIVHVDSGWRVPAGVAPEIVTAYRELKIQRVHTTEGSTRHWAIAALGELDDVLRSISHQERSPRPRQEVRP
ncbi:MULTISPECIES: HAD family hydrolase [Streptomyces]|uniref:HAD family hydrolase n=1 Tax=Streptomyces TaxID=1883 RepID=UPI000A67DBB2|nr:MULTISPECIES: HAD family hydrolase [Streptomyces]MBP5909139.1 HAD family hydrolase [Streptomyces sp. LBUM 1478]MBP5927997.1 HAD family hydrolase [Streptomyces sp. LBUM 1479]MBP5896485.1 HAD family hydrolase [Streptomyces sp. LBUM 1481]MBP5920510.1 HAD family hydrolase [Streptomyces sp. LBUM 1483]MDX2551677.1 HAD family hydrolase [Streptomyces stelliscabiei]